eukprot:6177990-Pleurochrysis_carterae.AAC.2
MSSQRLLTPLSQNAPWRWCFDLRLLLRLHSHARTMSRPFALDHFICEIPSTALFRTCCSPCTQFNIYGMRIRKQLCTVLKERGEKQPWTCEGVTHSPARCERRRGAAQFTLSSSARERRERALPHSAARLPPDRLLLPAGAEVHTSAGFHTLRHLHRRIARHSGCLRVDLLPVYVLTVYHGRHEQRTPLQPISTAISVSLPPPLSWPTQLPPHL